MPTLDGPMWTKVIKIALAFVGIIVGAGFATGQETVQYFASFGTLGIVGAVVCGLIIAVGGMIILQLGTFHLADEHRQVFDVITNRWLARFLDAGVMLTVFSLGFIMLAGAGATLNQELGWPTWAGSTVLLVMVLAVGFLDVDRVSALIGSITPLMMALILFAFGYVLLTQLPADHALLAEVAERQVSPMPNWWLAAVNNAGMCLMMGVSMTLVIGGNYLDPKVTGLGGLLGGVAYMVLLVMITVLVYLALPLTEGSDVPTVALLGQIHPALGVISVVVVFLMIYNTAIGMFYALGRRLSRNRPNRFPVYFVAVVLAGFAVSFVGFADLISVMFPVLGYLGLVLVAVMVVTYLRHRGEIAVESRRRVLIRALFVRRGELSAAETRRMDALVAASGIDDAALLDAVREDVDGEDGGEDNGSHDLPTEK